jgi:hypothetical protein
MTMSDADIESDSLIGTFKFRRKRITNKNKSKIYDISPLQVIQGSVRY